MSDNTIPITRPQTQNKIDIPPAVKKVLAEEHKTQTASNSTAAPDDSYADIPEQYVQRLTYPTETIGLPSNGWFYPENHPLANGLIEIKMMTAKEEDILTSQNLIKKGVVLKRLVDSLIVNKQIKQEDILLCDMNGILVAIRRLAYGDEYGPVKAKCPSCGEDTEVSVNLGLVSTLPFEFEQYPKGYNSFEFDLPYSKKRISYRLLTQREDEMIDLEVKNLSRMNKDRSTEVTTRLKHVIQSLDGDTDKSVIRKFVENELVSRDTLALRTHMKKNSPGLDMTFPFTCMNCDFADSIDIPMAVQFFWPSS